MVWIDVLCLCLSLYLDEVDSHAFASQLGWLGLLRHGADIGQTQLRLSLLRRKSRAAVLPPSSGAAPQVYHACCHERPLDKTFFIPDSRSFLKRRWLRISRRSDANQAQAARVSSGCCDGHSSLRNRTKRKHIGVNNYIVRHETSLPSHCNDWMEHMAPLSLPTIRKCFQPSFINWVSR